MSAVFDIHRDSALYRRESERFRKALANVDDAVPVPNRTQDRRQPVTAAPAARFSNTQDTDPSLPANRDWARQISARMEKSALGDQLVADHTMTDPSAVDPMLADTAAAGAVWARKTGTERAAVLRAAAVEFERHRAGFIEVAGSETGKTIDQADPEVSEAIDFAELLRRSGRGPGHGRRRRPCPGRAHPGHPAVELPCRHPGRRCRRGPRRRLRRRDQTRTAGQALRRAARRVIFGPQASRRTSCAWCTSRRMRSARRSSPARGSTVSSSPARSKPPSCSAASARTSHCSRRRPARTPS